jgi:hypothetical protein
MMTDTLTRLEHLEARQVTLLRVIAIQLLAPRNPSVDDLTLAIERLEVLEGTLAAMEGQSA